MRQRATAIAIVASLFLAGASREIQATEPGLLLGNAKPEAPGSFYGGVEAKEVHVWLPSYKFVQRFTNTAPRVVIEEIDTADGNMTDFGVGITAGIQLGDLFEIGGQAVLEASGVFSHLDQSDQTDFAGVSGVTRVGWTMVDGSGGFQLCCGRYIRTFTEREVSILGGDIVFKQALYPDDGVKLEPFVGFSSLHIAQDFDFFAYMHLSTVNEMVSVEELNATYLGGIVGLALTGDLQQNTAATVNAALKLYHMDVNYEADQNCDVAGFALCNRVVKLNLTRQMSTLGARVGGEIAHDFGPFVMKLTSQLDYLRDVPKIIYPTSRTDGIPASIGTESSWVQQAGLQLLVPLAETPGFYTTGELPISVSVFSTSELRSTTTPTQFVVDSLKHYARAAIDSTTLMLGGGLSVDYRLGAGSLLSNSFVGDRPSIGFTFQHAQGDSSNMQYFAGNTADSLVEIDGSLRRLFWSDSTWESRNEFRETNVSLVLSGDPVDMGWSLAPGWTFAPEAGLVGRYFEQDYDLDQLDNAFFNLVDGDLNSWMIGGTIGLKIQSPDMSGWHIGLHPSITAMAANTDMTLAQDKDGRLGLRDISLFVKDTLTSGVYEGALALTAEKKLRDVTLGAYVDASASYGMPIIHLTTAQGDRSKIKTGDAYGAGTGVKATLHF